MVTQFNITTGDVRHFVTKDSIGYDRLVDRITANKNDGFPPYNIRYRRNAITEEISSFTLELAVAGFTKKQLSITVENGSLLIKGTPMPAEQEDPDNYGYVHNGIALRGFEKSFDMAEHMEVIGSDLKDGMLYIDMERKVPDALKPKQIDIKYK